MDTSRDLIGSVIKGTYQIDAFLGEGGPSVVYRGTDLLLEVPVAIKRLKHLASMGDGSSMAERFLREGRTQAKLVHQNIIGIRAVLEENDEYYIVMEYVEGCDLARMLAELPTHRFSFQAIGGVFLQVLQGLGYAHEHHVIHRDIKPSNIMVTPDARVKIADFGIARAITDSRITQTGYLVGTVAYMCPEQLKGEKVDHRADIYSLGITLFEALAAQHPFRIHEGELGNFEVMSRHIYEQAPPVSSLRPDAPPQLDDVLMRALAKDPEERFSSCDEFAQALRDALQHCGVETPDNTLISQEFSEPFRTIGLQRNAAAGARPATDDFSPPEPPAASNDAEGTGTFNRDAMAPSSPAQDEGTGTFNREGTGKFNRDELPPSAPSDAITDSSEERPSGVLVSVSVSSEQLPASVGRSTAEAPVSPAERLMQQDQQAKHELEGTPSHPRDLNKTQLDTGSFFQEENDAQATDAHPAPETLATPSAQEEGTGQFNREALSQKIQANKNKPTGASTLMGTEAIPGLEEAANAPNEHPAKAQTDDVGGRDGVGTKTIREEQDKRSDQPPPTISDGNAGTKSSRGGFFVVLLIAGLIAGGGGIWAWQAWQGKRGKKTAKLGSKKLSGRRAPTGRSDAPDAQGTPLGQPLQPNGTIPRSMPSSRCPSKYGEMAYLNGGSFLQGRATRSRRSKWPQRSTTLSPFCIDRAEVTAGAYQRCVDAGYCTPAQRERQRPTLPVRWVTWAQAHKYCRWAGKKELPTEAQWEFAARGGRTTYYPWGSQRQAPSCKQAIHSRCKGPKAAVEGMRSVSGLRDMLGNVAEWVYDCYRPNAYKTLPSHDPRAEPQWKGSGGRRRVDLLRGCRWRVVRGGSYRSRRRSQELTPFHRDRLHVSRHKAHIGFRCAAKPLAGVGTPARGPSRQEY